VILATTMIDLGRVKLPVPAGFQGSDESAIFEQDPETGIVYPLNAEQAMEDSRREMAMTMLWMTVQVNGSRFGHLMGLPRHLCFDPFADEVAA
jgi:hypothetical protein